MLDVTFLDAQHGFAVGAYGALLETTDGGQHWQDVAERLDNPDQLHLNGIAHVRDAGLFIVGEQGGMFRSTDNGQTWAKVQGPYEGSLFGVIGTARPQTLLAYGLRGNLFRSSDFGDSWQPIELKAARGTLEFGLAGATLVDDGSLVLVGNGGSSCAARTTARPSACTTVPTAWPWPASVAWPTAACCWWGRGCTPGQRRRG